MSVSAAALSTPVELALAAAWNEDAVRTILFFDGVCGLCNASVNFVLDRDRSEQIKFAPLQGETARQLLPDADRESLSSVVLWVEGKTYRKSAAIVRVLWRLSLFWRVLGTLLWCIPLPLRNLGYLLVARCRYRVFGRHETCRMPSERERTRFLP